MPGMIGDVKLLRDQIRHSVTGPQECLITQSLRTFFRATPQSAFDPWCSVMACDRLGRLYAQRTHLRPGTAPASG
jgi:hypothetical protein